MIRLLLVELRRLRARRLAVLVMLGTLAVPVLLLLSMWQTVQPPGDAQLAEAERFYAEQLAQWEEDGDEMVAQCREDEEREREATGQDIDFGCDMQEPQLEWFLHVPPPFGDSVLPMLGTLFPVLVFAGLLVGATFTAAELATGSMGTWLTFEPRRLRVYASKVLAPAVGMVPVAVVALAVLLGGGWLLHDANDLTGTMTADRWGEAAWMCLRLVALAGLAGLVGAALGVLVRHTAAVLGIGIAYVIAEQVLGGIFPRLQPWLVLRNLEGWVHHGTLYYLEVCTAEGTGMVCEYTDRALSFGHAAVYVLALSAVIAGVGALVFRRRDVT